MKNVGSRTREEINFVLLPNLIETKSCNKIRQIFLTRAYMYMLAMVVCSHVSAGCLCSSCSPMNVWIGEVRWRVRFNWFLRKGYIAGRLLHCDKLLIGSGVYISIESDE